MYKQSIDHQDLSSLVECADHAPNQGACNIHDGDIGAAAGYKRRSAVGSNRRIRPESCEMIEEKPSDAPRRKEMQNRGVAMTCPSLSLGNPTRNQGQRSCSSLMLRFQTKGSVTFHLRTEERVRNEAEAEAAPTAFHSRTSLLSLSGPHFLSFAPTV